MDEFGPGVARVDHLVHVATAGGVVGVGKQLRVLRFLLGQFGGGVFGGGNLPAEDDLRGALGPHDGNLSRGPRKHQVRADVA